MAETKDETIVDEQMFEKPPVYLEFTVGRTLNQGNYESARINVGMTIPCYLEEIDEVFEFAKDWVDKKASEIIDSLTDTE